MACSTWRNTQLPGVSAQLSSYVTGAVQAINQASNAASSVPPPNTLTGSNIGIDLTTAIGSFSGTTNIAVVSSATGVIQQQVAVDFSTGQMTDGSGAVTNFTPANFLSSLNIALGGAATASFNNGVLSIAAQSGRRRHPGRRRPRGIAKRRRQQVSASISA